MREQAQTPKTKWDKEMSRTLIWEHTRKHPTIKVDIYLKHEDGKLCFSAIGQVVCEGGGQCQDLINEYLKGDEVWDKLYYLWENYHLNDMNAGTIKQDRLLKMGHLAGVDLSDYDKQCEFLAEYNCLYDDGYKYGSEWLYREIPEDDLWDIIQLLRE